MTVRSVRPLLFDLSLIVVIVGGFSLFLAHCQQLPNAPEKLPYDSVDCDNANGNPKLCTIEPDEPDAPSAVAGKQKLVAPPEWQPNHKHLKFVTNHPTRTAIIGIAGAGLLGAFLWKQPHCSHYEYGNNGVNVPCPKEVWK